MRGPGVLIVLALFTSIGCAHFRDERFAQLRTRASFELHCPAEQIQLTPLDSAARKYGAGTTGVSGCGEQATYLWDAYRGVWVMNDASRTSAR